MVGADTITAGRGRVAGTTHRTAGLVQGIKLTVPDIAVRTAGAACQITGKPKGLALIVDLGASGTGRILKVEAHETANGMRFIQAGTPDIFPYTVNCHAIDKKGLLQSMQKKLCGVSHRYLMDIPRLIAVDTFGAGGEILHEDMSPLTELLMYTDPLRQEFGARHITRLLTIDEKPATFDGRQGTHRHLHFMSAGQGWGEYYNVHQFLAAVRAAGVVIPDDAKIFGMPDVLNYFLCGVRATESSFARVFNCANRDGLTWNNELLGMLGIPVSAFAQIVPTGTKLGPVRNALLRDLCCDKADVIAGGTHDTAGAIKALQLMAPKGKIFISSGSWNLVCALIDAANLNGEQIDTLYKQHVGVEGGTGATFGVVNTRGGMLDKSLCNDFGLTGNDRFARLFAASHLAGTYAAIVHCMSAKFPFVQDGPAVGPINAFCDATKQKRPSGMDEYAKTALLCMLLGMAEAVQQNIGLMKALYGETPDGIMVGGGPMYNRTMLQALATITGLPVTTTYESLAPMGNAAILMIGAGYHEEQVVSALKTGSENITFEPEGTDRQMWQELLGRHNAMR